MAFIPNSRVFKFTILMINCEFEKLITSIIFFIQTPFPNYISILFTILDPRSNPNFIKLQRANSTLLSPSSRNLHASKAHRSASKIHRHPPAGIRIVKSKLISNAAAANTWRRGPVPRFPAPLSENFFPLFVSPLFSSARLGSIEPLRLPRCE